MTHSIEASRETRSGDLSGSYRQRLCAIAFGLLFVGAACLPLDVPIAAWIKTHGLPRELNRLLNFMEIFAHGTGITVLFLALLAIDPSLRSRPAWPGTFARMVAALLTASACTSLLKSLIERVRPRAADLGSLASVFGTFGTSSLIDGRGGADVLSFPSGHAGAAAAFAAALAWRYPQGTAAFAVIAALAATQRVSSSAHYPSDIAFGAAVGLLAASVWLGPPPLGAQSRSSVPTTN
ncbi:MAG: phosphatase PAP2 family protein [Pirellulales bacterium]